MCNNTLTSGLVSRERHRRMRLLHISAWASALPSNMNRAMREASDGRTATDTDSCAFLITNLTPTRGGPKAM